jgi:hypothetical protein
MLLRIGKIVLDKLSTLFVNAASFAGLTKNEVYLIKRIKRKHLTYLTEKRLAHIANSCKQIEKKGIEGMFIEAGCALGGSAILISSIKDIKRPFSVYDVFGMIPPPTEEDPQEVHNRYQTITTGKSGGIGGDKYYGYEENLYDKVYANFNSFEIEPKINNIQLIKGLLQHTMVIEAPVAFAHIDVDWYEPVKVSLERIFPYLSAGGCIVLDDYHDWGGCKKATDEFLATVPGQFILSDDRDGSVSIVKTMKIISNLKS